MEDFMCIVFIRGERFWLFRLKAFAMGFWPAVGDQIAKVAPPPQGNLILECMRAYGAPGRHICISAWIYHKWVSQLQHCALCACFIHFIWPRSLCCVHTVVSFRLRPQKNVCMLHYAFIFGQHNQWKYCILIDLKPQCKQMGKNQRDKIL